MKNVTTDFTDVEKQAVKRVVFALAACSWKQTEYAGVADETADEDYLRNEITRLETMISCTADRISDGSHFWMRQIQIVQLLIDLHREELDARSKSEPLTKE